MKICLHTSITRKHLSSTLYLKYVGLNRSNKTHSITQIYIVNFYSGLIKFINGKTTLFQNTNSRDKSYRIKLTIFSYQNFSKHMPCLTSSKCQTNSVAASNLQCETKFCTGDKVLPKLPFDPCVHLSKAEWQSCQLPHRLVWGITMHRTCEPSLFQSSQFAVASSRAVTTRA